jgi:hypothetical protein
MRSESPIILMPLIWFRVEKVVDTRFCTSAFHAILAGPIPRAVLPVKKLDTGVISHQQVNTGSGVASTYRQQVSISERKQRQLPFQVNTHPIPVL